VDDERIKRRTFLGGENLGHGSGIEGIGGEPVNGLGGQGDDFTGTQQRAGLAHGICHFVIGGMDNSGLGHAASLTDAAAGCEARFFSNHAARMVPASLCK
jgi:hypothetical protein